MHLKFSYFHCLLHHLPCSRGCWSTFYGGNSHAFKSHGGNAVVILTGIFPASGEKVWASAVRISEAG